MSQVIASRLSEEEILFVLGARLWKLGRIRDHLLYKWSVLKFNLRYKMMSATHKVRVRAPFWLQHFKDMAYDFLIGLTYFTGGLLILSLLFGLVYYVQVIQ